MVNAQVGFTGEDFTRPSANALSQTPRSPLDPSLDTVDFLTHKLGQRKLEPQRHKGELITISQ